VVRIDGASITGATMVMVPQAYCQLSERGIHKLHCVEGYCQGLELIPGITDRCRPDCHALAD
jgi:hypothetical protein